MKANHDLNLTVLVVSVSVIGLLGSSVKADFVFGKPTNLGPNINSSSWTNLCWMTADGLGMYIASNRPGGYGSLDLYVATRESTDDDWGPPVNLGPTVNTPGFEGHGCISADGLELYFLSVNRPGGSGSNDLWVTTRATKADKWRTPVNLGPTVNSSSQVPHGATLSSDGLSLYFASNRAGGSGSWDLWVTTRATLSDPWGPPVNLGSTVNSLNADIYPSISSDGLLLFFDSGPAGGFGDYDLWVSTRKTTDDQWGTTVNLGPPVNTSADDGAPNVSADGRTLYFSSNRPGSYGSWDLWQAPIIPIVDFNGDGKVDIQDLLRLIESWGKDDPSVDIGPMPWGDGKVDEKDLEVLMSYWQQEILDPALAAYWKLDETSGMMAADSIGANNGTLVGDPLWQPAGGKLGGALQLDGVDDCVTTEFIRDPSEGPFSVLAWVKGGAPGQVIVSQVNGANWLMAGASDGALMTELKYPSRKVKPLASQAVITDGKWHRVGFVWDGSHRILYVDGIEVAKDAQTALTPSTGGLCIGGPSDPAAGGAFWSGLIDDVRIYDRAMTP